MTEAGIALHHLHIHSVLGKLALAPSSSEVAAFVTNSLGLQNPHAGEGSGYEAHLRSQPDALVALEIRRAQHAAAVDDQRSHLDGLKDPGKS